MHFCIFAQLFDAVFVKVSQSFLHILRQVHHLILTDLIKIHPRSGWFFLFGHSPKRNRQRTSASYVGLPAMQLLFTTHKWVPWVKYAQLITLLVILQLICYVFLYGFCVFPHGVNVISLTPKFAVSVCKFHIAPFLEYHQQLFPFKYPMNPETLILGGIAIIICI